MTSLTATTTTGIHDATCIYCTLYTLCTKVNGMNVESYCHDDAVTILKNAGDNVLLTLKYFEPASGFLSLKGMLHYTYYHSRVCYTTLHYQQWRI